jgi:hypothetical protein
VSQLWFGRLRHFPQVFLHNLAEMNPTVINDEVVSNYKKLAHGDVLSIGDRKFRFEYST